MKKYIISLVLVAATMLACDNMESVIETGNENELVLSPIYPGIHTKATEAGFETGDEIGVFITKWSDGKSVQLQLGGNWGNNILLTNQGSSWILSPKVYWNEEKFDIYAYYPYDNDLSSVDQYPFSVFQDQTILASSHNSDAFEMSDFLWAKELGKTQSANVPLSFKHKMSKLIINLVKGRDYEGDIPDDAIVFIHNTVTDALIDLSTGDVIKTPRAPVHTIKARKNDTGKYSAIIVPQMLANKLPLIEIQCGKISYLLESKFNFKTGMCHIVNITLDDNPEKVAITIGGEIENWN